ncbi:MAG: glutathione ABC transporter permease GsiC, partial [Proteobacteria bacterium]|nr:glutathione ABC transporter permease GsiC [Pseudomonadota bacterium]
MGYLARRSIHAVLIVWLVATLVFAVLRLIPGDPAEMLLSSGGIAPDPSAVAELRSRLGLDQPVLTQYVDFMRGLLHLDLG